MIKTLLPLQLPPVPLQDVEADTQDNQPSSEVPPQKHDGNVNGWLLRTMMSLFLSACPVVVVEIEEDTSAENKKKQLQHLDSFSTQTTSDDTQKLI